MIGWRIKRKPDVPRLKKKHFGVFTHPCPNYKGLIKNYLSYDGRPYMDWQEKYNIWKTMHPEFCPKMCDRLGTIKGPNYVTISKQKLKSYDHEIYLVETPPGLFYVQNGWSIGRSNIEHFTDSWQRKIMRNLLLWDTMFDMIDFARATAVQWWWPSIQANDSVGIVFQSEADAAMAVGWHEHMAEQTRNIRVSG